MSLAKHKRYVTMRNMKTALARPTRSRCPVNVAVEILGDRWTLLVLRDLMLKGRVTFKSMIEAEEGIATNMLTDRLSRLEAEGIVEKLPDENDKRRARYRLTPKGLDLAPVLVDMMVWSATYYDTAAPPHEIDDMRRNRRRYLAAVRAGVQDTQSPERASRR
jgi:DNA-binding HxlR family transcriptional regulator